MQALSVPIPANDAFMQTDKTIAGIVRQVPSLLWRIPLFGYRWFISPFMPATCRHVPSCSTYAQTAFERHGAWRGGWLTVSRLARCHPWGSQGLDPVPDRITECHGVFSAWRYGRWNGRHIVHRFADETND